MKKQTVEFFAPVLSRAELEGVVPKADLAFAYHKSKRAYGGHYIFVYAEGAWGEDSVMISDDRYEMRLGGDIDIILPDGETVPAVFSVLGDRPVAFPVTPTEKSVPNYSERYYTHQM